MLNENMIPFCPFDSTPHYELSWRCCCERDRQLCVNTAVKESELCLEKSFLSESRREKKEAYIVLRTAVPDYDRLDPGDMWIHHNNC